MNDMEERVVRLEVCVEKLTELVTEMRQDGKAKTNRMKDWALGIVAGVMIVVIVGLGTYTMSGFKSEMQEATTISKGVSK